MMIAPIAAMVAALRLFFLPFTGSARVSSPGISMAGGMIWGAMSNILGLSLAQVSLGVLRPMQDADDFQRVAKVAEIDHMRSAGVFQVSGARAGRPAALLASSQGAANVPDFRGVFLGFGKVPFGFGIIPDAV